MTLMHTILIAKNVTKQKIIRTLEIEFLFDTNNLQTSFRLLFYFSYSSVFFLLLF